MIDLIPAHKRPLWMYVIAVLLVWAALFIGVWLFDRERFATFAHVCVEYVMGFCTEAQHRRFLEVCPEFELFIVDDGILLIKLWLEVSWRRGSWIRAAGPIVPAAIKDHDLTRRREVV